MAATIRFLEGIEATLIDESGTWICEDEELAENLRLRAELFLSEKIYLLSPLNDLARDVAEMVGAEIVRMDPDPDGFPGDLGKRPEKR